MNPNQLHSRRLQIKSNATATLTVSCYSLSLQLCFLSFWNWFTWASLQFLLLKRFGFLGFLLCITIYRAMMTSQRRFLILTQAIPPSFPGWGDWSCSCCSNTWAWFWYRYCPSCVGRRFRPWRRVGSFRPLLLLSFKMPIYSLDFSLNYFTVILGRKVIILLG